VDDHQVSRRAVILATAAVGLAACSRAEPGVRRAGTPLFGDRPTTTEPRPPEPTPSAPDIAAGSADLVAAGHSVAPMPPPTTGSVPTTGHPAPIPIVHPAIDPAEIRANELGVVPVMMYHRITAQMRSEYDTTPGDFRGGLQRMFRAGYRPARAIDLVRGQFDVAPGYTPVVLTFDDAYADQLRLQPDGRVDPSCAVGILLSVCRQFPSCRPAGTFNINNNPFGLDDPTEQARALTLLHRLGFEVGNHTYGHDNLTRMAPDGIERDFVLLQRLVVSAVPGVAVRTMALPYGAMPASARAAAVLRRGRWGGDSYVNEATFLAGANPSVSPFAADFDPQRVPRIRSTSWRGGTIPLTGRYWLDYLDAHPHERYVSAGRPGHVTIPRSVRSQLAGRYARRVVTY
jgi:Polysaccharide deacetylase